MDWMPLLSANKQYQSTEQNSIHSPNPANNIHWPHPFFIDHWTPDGRGAAPSMSTVRYQ